MRFSRGIYGLAGGGLIFAVLTIISLRSQERAKEKHDALPLGLSAQQNTGQTHLSPFQQKIIRELKRQTHANIMYRSDYFPGGEPPPQYGVCTDVVLRAYRAAGVRLRQAVNADIAAHPAAYPVTKPDPNIDHRRCRNLLVFFRRHAKTLPENADWQAGDIVFWDIYDRGLADHVGVVGSHQDEAGNPSVVQHITGGLPVLETGDIYHWTVRAHFRWPAS